MKGLSTILLLKQERLNLILESMKSMNRIFLRGFITLLPIALTIYIIYSAVLILENLLGSLLRLVFPEAYYIPGLGLVLTMVTIFFFGLTLNSFIAAKTLFWVEGRVKKIPFISAVYSPLKDLMNLFGKQDGGDKRSVVLVELSPSLKILGIVTREAFADLGLGSILTDRVAVYIPFSYGMGGYTVLVPKSSITPINVPIEKAMSLAITAWVKADGGQNG